jgi:hypothetical protein
LAKPYQAGTYTPQEIAKLAWRPIMMDDYQMSLTLSTRHPPLKNIKVVKDKNLQSPWDYCFSGVIYFFMVVIHHNPQESRADLTPLLYHKNSS